MNNTKEALDFLYQVEGKRFMIKPEAMMQNDWWDYKAITAIFQRIIEILEKN